MNRHSWWLPPSALLLSCLPPAPAGGASNATNAWEAPAVTEVQGPYRRHDWRHWIDADHDCQDTRQEVLIAESEVPVEFADARHCKVTQGRWTCPYTGQTVTDPGKLDIDHLVPLENAFRSGAWRWSTQRKRDYANDLAEPEHLVAVTAAANRQKGSRGPEAWLPTRGVFRCEYVAAWDAIKRAGTSPFRRRNGSLSKVCATPAALTWVDAEDPQNRDLPKDFLPAFWIHVRFSKLTGVPRRRFGGPRDALSNVVVL